MKKQWLKVVSSREASDSKTNTLEAIPQLAKSSSASSMYRYALRIGASLDNPTTLQIGLGIGSNCLKVISKCCEVQLERCHGATGRTGTTRNKKRADARNCVGPPNRLPFAVATYGQVRPMFDRSNVRSIKSMSPSRSISPSWAVPPTPKCDNKRVRSARSTTPLPSRSVGQG